MRKRTKFADHRCRAEKHSFSSHDLTVGLYIVFVQLAVRLWARSRPQICSLGGRAGLSAEVCGATALEHGIQRPSGSDLTVTPATPLRELLPARASVQRTQPEAGLLILILILILCE